MRRILFSAKAWARLTCIAAIIGLLSDLFNGIQQYRLALRSREDKPIVYEDFSPTTLPECAFAAPFFKEEAEPNWYLNLADWITGIGPAEESAYSKAEQKIRRNVLAEKTSSGADDIEKPSDSTAVNAGQESTESRNLQIIRKKFYFDEHGYRAEIVMGHLRNDLNQTLELGCETQSDRGNLERRIYSREFACNSLDAVIAQEIERANTSRRPDKCTVSLRFSTNFQTMKVAFTEELFTREPEETADVVDLATLSK